MPSRTKQLQAALESGQWKCPNLNMLLFISAKFVLLANELNYPSLINATEVPPPSISTRRVNIKVMSIPIE